MQDLPELETMQCALCSSTDYKVVYPARFPSHMTQDFLVNLYRSSSDESLFEQVVRCTACSLVYLNPRLNSDIIVGSYAEGNDMAFIKQDEMRIRTFTTALRRLRNKHKLSLSNESHILDIGCAGGAFLQAAKNLGISGIGLEPNKWMCEYARSTYGIDARSGTLRDHHFPDETFDLVSLWDVIEHVPSPKDVLEEIQRIVKPGGVLIVNYPDFGSLPAQLLGRKWPFLLSVHLFYYTRKTMRKQLTQAGFHVVDMRMHWQTLELSYVLQRITPYFSIAGYIKTFIEKIGIGSIPITYWIGQTQVIARR